MKVCARLIARPSQQHRRVSAPVLYRAQTAQRAQRLRSARRRWQCRAGQYTEPGSIPSRAMIQSLSLQRAAEPNARCVCVCVWSVVSSRRLSVGRAALGDCATADCVPPPPPPPAGAPGAWLGRDDSPLAPMADWERGGERSDPGSEASPDGRSAATVGGWTRRPRRRPRPARPR